MENIIGDVWVYLVISARGHEERVILLVDVEDACARAGASCIRRVQAADVQATLLVQICGLPF